MKSNKPDGSSGKAKDRGNRNLGNEAGFETRFVKGQSGNPGGRPTRTPFTDAVRVVAELTVAELKTKPTDPAPIAIAKKLALDAVNGKTQTAVELANRAEGTPRQRAEIFPAEQVVFKVVYADRPIKNPAALENPWSPDTGTNEGKNLKVIDPGCNGTN